MAPNGLRIANNLTSKRRRQHCSRKSRDELVKCTLQYYLKLMNRMQSQAEMVVFCTITAQNQVIVTRI